MFFKKLLKKIVHFFCKKNIQINISTENELFILKNIYKKTYEKNALLSFITTPFNNKTKDFSHTNSLECLTIAQILDELNYNVDVVNYNENITIIPEKYDLIIGFGQAIENIFYKINEKKFKLILYRNGADSHFSDKIALERIHKVYLESNQLFLNSMRIFPTPWKIQHYFADSIITLGNKFVSETYKKNKFAELFSVDLFYYDVGTIKIAEKNFDKAKFNFLWFGSLGAIHKGLDLVLEYFSQKPDYNLYVAGLNSKEINFIKYYGKYFDLENISNLGFVPIQSEKFKTLLYDCGAIITPTISEGGGGATINILAAGGLIPIVTENIGLDFDNNEIIISDFTVSAVNKSIEEYSAISTNCLKQNSENIMQYIRQKHSYNKYKQNLKDRIDYTLKK